MEAQGSRRRQLPVLLLWGKWLAGPRPGGVPWGSPLLPRDCCPGPAEHPRVCAAPESSAFCRGVGLKFGQGGSAPTSATASLWDGSPSVPCGGQDAAGILFPPGLSIPSRAAASQRARWGCAGQAAGPGTAAGPLVPLSIAPTSPRGDPGQGAQAPGKTISNF